MEPGVRDIASYSFLTSPGSTIEAASTFSLQPKAKITVEKLLWGLDGVGRAIKGPNDKVQLAKYCLPTVFENASNSTSLRDWCHLFAEVQISEDLRQCLNLSLALTFLLQCGQEGIDIARPDFDFAWNLTYGALVSNAVDFNVNRSALGYHSVPLWDHKQEDGSINELFRLHVFVPDDHEKRTPITNIHTHQAFSQGWTLTGLGTDYVYEIKPTEEHRATHAEYGIGWKPDQGGLGRKATFSQQSASSTMTKTTKFVRAVPSDRRLHTRGTNYTVPAGKFHALDVGADELHATLFFFDSSRGFQLQSPALGPLDGSTGILEREDPRASARQLAKTVDCLRKWEDHFSEGRRHVRTGSWEEALKALRVAERYCDFLDGEPYSPLKHAPRYKWAVAGEIGHMFRMYGQNAKAIDVLVPAVREIPRSLQRIEIMGELSVVYRHENNLSESMKCTKEAYETAVELLKYAQDPAMRLALEKEKCRAVGDWGMVRYQLYLQFKDTRVLNQAMRQMEERIEIATNIRNSPDLRSLNSQEQEELVEYCWQREAIARARLSLCYTEKKNIAMALEMSRKALDIQLNTQKDPTKVAFSRYFYGRALHRAGRMEEAMEEWNGPPNTCTPTIALCKEASDEHRGYIREMVEAGADMEQRDEQGYSALECAVYGEDPVTQRVVEEGLRGKFHTAAMDELYQASPNPTDSQLDDIPDIVEQKLVAARHEAEIRRGYRKLVQETLRKVFLRAESVADLGLVRNNYAKELATINNPKQLFDSLRVVPYANFIGHERIPKYGDGVTKEIEHGSKADEFVIFFSYRWIGPWDAVKKSASPDDDKNTQYKHMVTALKYFIKGHPEINEQKICVWIDYSCVDQQDGLCKDAGIVSLPLNLAQCNAMISLTDDNYYDRAWCAVEIMMVQTLRRSYRFHMWFAYVFDEIQDTTVLQKNPVDVEVVMKTKKVTFATDWPILLFLERQCKLLQ